MIRHSQGFIHAAYLRENPELVMACLLGVCRRSLDHPGLGPFALRKLTATPTLDGEANASQA